MTFIYYVCMYQGGPIKVANAMWVDFLVYTMKGIVYSWESYVEHSLRHRVVH